APGNRIRAYVAPPKPWAGGALPLGAIYILRSRAGRPNIAPLDAAAALRALKRNAHRPALVRKSGHSARYFQATARMLRYAGVFTASRQRDLAQLPEMARVLEAHWRGAGLGHDPILATADGSTRPC
ncbi:MAG TPA: hypothetical protein VKT52_12215, partial [Ktedonobacterales bacterium]|nr:hypothetical protein [Ktedonobacterales bacterium]